MTSLLRQPCESAQFSRVAALRVYVEECEEAARLAEQEGRHNDQDWWVGEELAARGALLEAERA